MSLFRKSKRTTAPLEDYAPPPFVDLVAMAAGLTWDEWDQWRREHRHDQVPARRREHWRLLEDLRAWKAER